MWYCVYTVKLKSIYLGICRCFWIIIRMLLLGLSNLCLKKWIHWYNNQLFIILKAALLFGALCSKLSIFGLHCCIWKIWNNLYPNSNTLELNPNYKVAAIVVSLCYTWQVLTSWYNFGAFRKWGQYRSLGQGLPQVVIKSLVPIIWWSWRMAPGGCVMRVIELYPWRGHSVFLRMR